MHPIPPKRANAPTPADKSADTNLSAAFRSALGDKTKRPHSIDDAKRAPDGTTKKRLDKGDPGPARQGARPAPPREATLAQRKRPR